MLIDGLVGLLGPNPNGVHRIANLQSDRNLKTGFLDLYLRQGCVCACMCTDDYMCKGYKI